MARFRIELGREINHDCGEIVVEAEDEMDAADIARGMALDADPRIKWASGDGVLDVYVNEVTRVDLSDPPDVDTPDLHR